MQQEIMAIDFARFSSQSLCLTPSAIKRSPLKKLTLFTLGFPAISYAIDNNSNNIEYCPNNGSLDRYTQNGVLDIFEEVSEGVPARSFLIVVNVVLRLFNPVNNYIL
jgi:hypothetical protein